MANETNITRARRELLAAKTKAREAEAAAAKARADAEAAADAARAAAELGEHEIPERVCTRANPAPNDGQLVTHHAETELRELDGEGIPHEEGDGIVYKPADKRRTVVCLACGAEDATPARGDGTNHTEAHELIAPRLAKARAAARAKLIEESKAKYEARRKAKAEADERRRLLTEAGSPDKPAIGAAS